MIIFQVKHTLFFPSLIGVVFDSLEALNRCNGLERFSNLVSLLVSGSETHLYCSWFFVFECMTRVPGDLPFVFFMQLLFFNFCASSTIWSNAYAAEAWKRALPKGISSERTIWSRSASTIFVSFHTSLESQLYLVLGRISFGRHLKHLKPTPVA